MTQDKSFETSTTGEHRVAEATQAMPVTKRAMEKFLPVGSLAGMRIGSTLFLDPKSAAFLRMLKAAGAEIDVLPTVGTVDTEIVQTLKKAGLSVLWQDPDLDGTASATGAKDLLARKPDIVLDEAGVISNAMSADEAPKCMIDQTASGRRALESAIKRQTFGGVAIALDTSPLAQLVDAGCGVGQSAVLAFVDVTNLQLGGRRVLVCGFDAVGESVAHFARAFGAKVMIAETDPLANLRALYKGYTLATIEDAAKTSEIVFVASDKARLTLSQLADLPHGANICVVTDAQDQLPMASLEAGWSGQDVRRHVRQYTSPQHRLIHIIAGGGPIAKVAGEGSPVEAMDIVFALHAAALATLLVRAADGACGLLALPTEIETTIAELKLV